MFQLLIMFSFWIFILCFCIHIHFILNHYQYDFLPPENNYKNSKFHGCFSSLTKSISSGKVLTISEMLSFIKCSVSYKFISLSFHCCSKKASIVWFGPNNFCILSQLLKCSIDVLLIISYFKVRRKTIFCEVAAVTGWI